MEKIVIAAALVFVVLILALYVFVEFYDFNKFKPKADRYIADNFNSRADASRHYGHHYTYINKCFNGQRPFPDLLLKDMGYKLHSSVSHDYRKEPAEVTI